MTTYDKITLYLIVGLFASMVHDYNHGLTGWKSFIINWLLWPKLLI